MKPLSSGYVLGILMISLLAVMSCTTRGIHDTYLGSTEQRLVTQSIDKLVKMLPEKDFTQLRGLNIALECHFIEAGDPLRYAEKRIEMELIEKYDAEIVAGHESADVILHVFFDSIGTDHDNLGFKTPDFIVPGAAGSISIDILTLDMYHGISELYYYMIDTDKMAVKRGEKIKSVVRTDRLALPLISIPINTLD